MVARSCYHGAMPRRIDIDLRKAQLAEAVWGVIRARGIGAVSVRSVADEAGVALGSLRHVFPTRTELILFSAELMVQRATDRIVAAPRSGDAVEDAVSLLSHLLPLEPDSRAELEVNIALIAEAPGTPELIPIRDHASRAIFGLCVRQVAALAPGLTERQVTAGARRLHALVDGLALHILAGTDADTNSWGVQTLRSEIMGIAALAP